MTNVLVTGGLGFIGSHFVDLLLSKGEYNVTVMDKVTYVSNMGNLTRWGGSVVFIKDDVCNVKKEDIKRGDYEFIVNFASATHVDVSIDNSFEFMNSNTMGTYHLLEATKDTSIKKFIQISSDEVYGSTETISYEYDALHPQSPYAAGKSGGDCIAQAYHHTYGMPVIITRACNNYGTRQHPEKLIPRCIKLLSEDKPIEIYGGGKNQREWIYVTDKCEAIYHLMQSKIKGEIFNIGTGDILTSKEIGEKIIELMGKDKDKYLKFIGDRPGHVLRHALSTEKIQNSGWAPKVAFEDGMKHLIAKSLLGEWFF